MLEIEKAIKKMIEELKKEYQKGRKKALGEILLLIKRDIFDLLDNKKFSIKMTKRIIEQALEIKISDNTFYKWVERQRKRNYTQKSNIEGKDVKKGTKPAPIPNQSQNPEQNKKEVQDEKSEVKKTNSENNEVLDNDMLEVVNSWKQI